MEDDPKDIKEVIPERFSIVREIGRGGMATVYLAEEQHPKRLVAIKVLNPELGARLGRERFIREVELLSNLTHPHIVPIFAAGEAQGLLYFVMPYQEGETLRERIHREGQLPIGFSLQIAREIADALQYAHGKNAVHRDIKPENVLISGEHAVVADFGIARAISASVGEGLTETGLSVGTPSYMSPEQASLGDSLDGRSDIYALGCVLYEMLAGEPPFTGRTPQAVMARHAVDPAPRLRTVRTTVPQDVEAAIQKALSKSPVDRFDTAADFGEALATASAVAHLEASTPSEALASLRPMSRPAAGRRWTTAAVVVALVLAIAVVWGRLGGGSASTALADFLYEDSVAVLPFAHIGGGDEFEHLGDGLTYEITSQLAQFGRLKVTARTSVKAIAGAGLTTPQMADTLGVRYLVEGSVQPSGNLVRVTAELVEARTGTILWSDQYQRELTDVLMVREEIAREVSSALLNTVSGGRPRGEEMVHSPAHPSFLEGKDLVAQRTPQAFRDAMVALERAIAIDPTYAPPYASLASVYALSVTYRYRIAADAYEAAGTALGLADRAIELDADLASAYSARGYAASVSLAPTESVRADFDRAMELQPNAPDGPAWLGHLLVREGRFDEALRTARRAVRLDPLAASRRISLAYEAMRDHQYDVVLEQTQMARRLSPVLFLPRELRGIALLLDGQAQECVQLGLGPYSGLRATCLVEVGREREAHQIVDSLETLLRLGRQVDTLFTNVIAAQGLAGHYAWLGDVDGALEWVTRAYELSPSGVDLRTIESGLFDRVRGDARFSERLTELRGEIWPKVSMERERASERGLLR
jgi:serine/threonine-protein kinase